MSGRKIIKRLGLILLFPMGLFGQDLTELTTLNSTINETSGLIYLNEKLITHNDSGGEAALYEIDTLTGAINRKVVIENAQNSDWEDICFDDTYIYIGDFGNNSGARTDLKIYRIAISDYMSTTNDTVSSETIQFSYADQVDYTPTSNASNFDAEALISFEDKLYIFTKNWNDYQSNVYALSKTPGTYQIDKTGHLTTQGLITGATFNTTTNTLLLSGYLFSAFVIEIHSFTNDQFSSGTMDKYAIQPTGSFQIESITPLNEKQYYLSSEENSSGASKLYRLKSKNYLAVSDPNPFSAELVYPNPATNQIRINSSGLIRVDFFDFRGARVKTANSHEIDLSDLEAGVYMLKIWKDNQQTDFAKLIKH
ncbi:MAG: T9SS type A sorting domain-containing protein [Bacteroidales bacterium]|nr:T9SS type A sorting domain-containing protein [Bacteroidales bacterium]